MEQNEQLMALLGTLVDSISMLTQIVAKQQDELIKQRQDEESENQGITNLMPSVEIMKTQLAQLQSAVAPAA